MNVGLRYEFFPPATDGDGHLNGLQLQKGNSIPESIANASAQFMERSHEPDNNNFAPRFGFAWNPKGGGTTAFVADTVSTSTGQASTAVGPRTRLCLPPSSSAPNSATHLPTAWVIPASRSSDTLLTSR